MSIRRNSLFGFLGFALPALVTLAAYPYLIHRIGTEAFGIYLLATSIGGLMSFLDGGLSAANLKFVAEDAARGRPQSAAGVIATSLLFYGVLGLLGITVLGGLAPWLVSLFRVEAALRGDAVWAFRLGGLLFAVSVLTSVFLSLFKGLQRFDLSAFSMGLLSVLTYGGCAAGVRFFGAGLIGVTSITLGANLFVLVVAACLGVRLCYARQIHLLSARPALGTLRRMLSFGVGMAAHSAAVMFYGQMLRILVGVLIGPSAVTIQALAIQVVSKSHDLLSAVTEVLFPLASAAERPHSLRRLYLRMLFGSGILSAAVLIPLTLLAKPLLTLWAGPQLAAQTAPLIPYFALAFFFVALSAPPFFIVNGFGRPWFNFGFDLFNIVIAITMISLFAVRGLTLVKFAMAYSTANLINGLAYQTAVEILIWRPLLRTPEAQATSATGTA